MTAALVALAGILTGGDLALTLVALRLPGLAEGNPILRALGRTGTVLLCWATVAALTWGAMAGAGWAIPIGVVVALGRAWVCLSNWRQIGCRLRW